MKKLLYILVFVMIIFTASCELPSTGNNIDNNNNNNQDSSLDGIDISKYEMPQTGFLHDGHTLTELEEVMKMVIMDGTFVYDKHLNSIGYKYVLDSYDTTTIYAFYHLSELRIMHLTMQGKIAHITYVKIFDDVDEFSIANKILYYSGRKQDFYAIMNCEKALFDVNYVGEYELYRGYNTSDKQTMTSLMLNNTNQMFNLMNDKLEDKLNYKLNLFGFSNY
jgi:hypothetical protein